ncbi:uncharacterized protein [Venturia canescens]|uniref:uncharacterized protein n=1 Tax=Venturia canescens TaxID=32260 RepID=UPI001C9C55C1|nr:uncharacterized protein LOC122409716 [Venturia canescens]
MALIFVPLVALIGVSLSAPAYQLPLTYVALSPIPENTYNQVQDTKSGEYAFGYAGGPVAREEAKTSDGVIRGAYSYVDAYGIVQYYRYIADDDGFRVVGTNIPAEEAHNPGIKIGEQFETSPGDSSNEPEERSASRKKRSAIAGALDGAEAIPTVPLTVATVSSVPTATSSQKRVQIHKSIKAEIGYPVALGEPVAVVPEIQISVKNADTIPVVVAASVQTSASGQSRHQVHNRGKTEFYVADAAVPVKTLVPAAPVELGSVEAVPALATSTSSQSRYQVHNSVGIESHKPEGVIGLETVEEEPVASIAVPAELGSAKIVPAAVIASVPIAGSSQSRFQVHSSVRTAAPIAVPSGFKSTEATAIEASLPISASPQSRFQVNDNLKTEFHNDDTPETPAASALASASDKASFQKEDNAKVGHGELARDWEHELRGLEPASGLQLANAYSEPFLSRHHVGVGLGVVPSPLVAYHTFASSLYA